MRSHRARVAATVDNFYAKVRRDGAALMSRLEAMARPWRKNSPHEYALAMGPVIIKVHRWYDTWMWHASIGGVTGAHFLRGHVGVGVPLEQCQADAIAAVERWRDEIR